MAELDSLLTSAYEEGYRTAAENFRADANSKDLEINELEATVEGLGQQNTELERDIVAERRRYARALALVENTQAKYDQMRSQAASLQETLQQVSGAYIRATRGVEVLAGGIGDLHKVPDPLLHQAIDDLQAEAYALLKP